MPLDAEPTEAGNVVLALGAAIVLSPKRLAPEGRARYMPHHATCPAPVRRRDGVSS
jgi:hypothetical protein